MGSLETHHEAAHSRRRCRAFAAASVAYAAGGTPDADAQARAEAEAAGLPDLRKINRPGAEVTSKVDFADIRRTPSFHEKSKNGTEVTEYRDRGKPVEIDVKSNFGTRYQMSRRPTRRRSRTTRASRSRACRR